MRRPDVVITREQVILLTEMLGAEAVEEGIRRTGATIVDTLPQVEMMVCVFIPEDQRQPGTTEAPCNDCGEIVCVHETTPPEVTRVCASCAGVRMRDGGVQ